MYFTDPVDNPFSRGLTALDENGKPETVDQSKLPGAKPLFSPRVGFNWNAVRRSQHPGPRRHRHLHRPGAVRVDRQRDLQSGREPEPVPGRAPGPRDHANSSMLAQSFDLNAMDPDFKWPQIWTTDLAIDQQLGGGMLGTLEVIYGKDLNNVFMRNADLVAPVRTLPDGRPVLRRRRRQRAQSRRRRGHLRASTTPARATTSTSPRSSARRSRSASATTAGLQLHRGEEQPQVHRDRQRAVAEPAGAGRSRTSRSSASPSSASGTASSAAPPTSSRGRERFRTSDRSLRRGGRGQPLRGRGRQPLLVHLLR